MKYYRVTAYTMYVGEELTDYIATDSDEKLCEFANELIEENAIVWEPRWGDYEEEGFDSEEAWQEEYFASAGARIEEITEEEYKEETKPVWPFDLVMEEN